MRGTGAGAGLWLVQTCLLTLWLGAALFFGAVVAPAAFRVLPAPSLAGALVGQLLPTLFVTGVLAGLAALAIELRSRAGTRSRSVAAAIMVVACATAHFVVGGQIARMRAALAAPVSSLASDDPRRVTFDRLHALSVLGLGAAMIAAAAAVAIGRGAHGGGNGGA